MSFSNGVHLETITEEQDCKDYCINNETCIGVYWGFDASLMNTSCWIQMPYSGIQASLRNANYWNLTACSGTPIIITRIIMRLIRYVVLYGQVIIS